MILEITSLIFEMLLLLIAVILICILLNIAYEITRDFFKWIYSGVVICWNKVKSIFNRNK